VEQMSQQVQENYKIVLEDRMETKRKEIIEQNQKYGEQWGYQKVERHE
jgi:hypothetical protein